LVIDLFLRLFHEEETILEAKTLQNPLSFLFRWELFGSFGKEINTPSLFEAIDFFPFLRTC